MVVVAGAGSRSDWCASEQLSLNCKLWTIDAQIYANYSLICSRRRRVCFLASVLQTLAEFCPSYSSIDSYAAVKAGT